MKTYKYKILALLFLGVSAVQAQTFDKKIQERFKVNPDVEIVIDTRNMDVTVETWNRNEVSIEAVMEVEGISEEEAEKFLENWKFEALGNKRMVKISSLSDNTFFEFNHDIHLKVDHDFDYNFDFNFDFPEIPEIPEMHEIPEFPEIPEMPELKNFEFDYEAYKNDSTYLKVYKQRVSKGVEEFKKSNWKKKVDSVMNSSEYKNKLKELKEASNKMAKDLKESKWFKEIKDLKNSKEFNEQMEATKEVLANRDRILEQVKLVKEANKEALEIIKRMKEEGKLDSLNHSENVYFFNSSNKNSKVKIKKHLKIRVPKKAIFNLNVRHGKVTIPESNKKMSANMSYGDFVGGIISGEKNELTFVNSPVSIGSLTSSNITLKNVPNAEFGTFEKVNMFSNSSDVIIDKIGVNVALSQKFGSINVKSIISNFNKLNLILDYAKANFDFSNASYVFKINGKKSTLNLNKKLTELNNKNVDGVQIIDGYYKNNSSINKLFLTGVFSSINLN